MGPVMDPAARLAGLALRGREGPSCPTALLNLSGLLVLQTPGSYRDMAHMQMSI